MIHDHFGRLHRRKRHSAGAVGASAVLDDVFRPLSVKKLLGTNAVTSEKVARRKRRCRGEVFRRKRRSPRILIVALLA